MKLKTVTMGNSLTLTYTYHISGAVKTATVQSADGNTLYSETLYYEDCGNNACTPQYNGNISRIAHELAHGNADFSQYRDVAYAYDQLNRLTGADDIEQDYFDESFTYDAQGRITAQRRYDRADSSNGGEYSYYGGTNKLKSVADNMGGSTSYRTMSANDNFAYDRDGNLVEDKSKQMKIAYDWRGMPVEFVRKTDSGDSLKLVMKYDGAGRRISKTLTRKVSGGEWDTLKVTHYTGIGTEIREYKPSNYVRFTDSLGIEHCVSANPDYSGNAPTTCPLPDTVRAVVPMPQGLGRYALQNTAYEDSSLLNAYEFYLKDHLGSTRMVYGSGYPDPLGLSPDGELRAAYDYRSLGEQIDLALFTRKVSENFTGKELDDETELGYWGARYLDLMLGMWTSVDAKRQYQNPYLYAGNNPIARIDHDGNADLRFAVVYNKDQNGNDLPSTLRSDVDRFFSQRLDPKYDTYKVKYFGSDAEARDINDFVNGGTYGALAIHGEYDGDYYYLHDGAGNEIYPDLLKFNVKTLFGACFSENYINNRSDENLVKPGYLPTGETQSFVESINFLIDNSDTEKINESGYDINFTDQ